MSLKEKLRRAPVEVHVTPADPMEAKRQEMNAVGDTFAALVDERNLYKQRAEQLMLHLDRCNHMGRQAIEERDNAQRRYLFMLEACGQLKATVAGMNSLARNAEKTILYVEHLLSQQPQHVAPSDLPQTNGRDEEAVDLDAALIQHAPEPTLEEIEQLKRYGPEKQ